MKARSKRLLLAVAIPFAVAGCTPEAANATVTALHDGFSSFATGMIDALFQTKFGFGEDNGNDVFIHN